MSKQLRFSGDQRGFTITELLVSTAVILIVTGSALATFQTALGISDTATQFADANQNLRAGVNQLIKDTMQAGRVIGPEGVPIPSGTGAQPIRRPGPPGTSLTFDTAAITNLPDITTGYRIGPTVNGQATDIITLLTVDPFMPIVDTPPDGAVDAHEGTIAGNGEHVTLPADSAWLVGDPQRGTPPIQVGDIVLFKNSRGMAMQVVTNIDPTHIHFNNNDWFNLNQRGAQQGTIMQLKDSANPSAGWAEKTSLFRLLMVTYYVDAATTPGAPRLMRVVNNFTPQALAGVIEDLDFTYDLVDGTNNPAAVTGLPYTDDGSGLTYTSNQIRKVNIHVGVRSESTSRGTGDYVRNHISTAVDVRSLASVDRYVSQ